ncbi:hypothetical protein AL036_05220 [Salipiger aestuarii]|uniref:Uncharacterized metal-binding protein YceD (DUF177 family) n=1 Tax=Salipiger aestuarii TaxID=568098 RepID=A0A327YJ60_9RHOB|nr:DUF177 domain-containing protein [Salipiger aestuarii]EIE52219.1 hypothetical protein C357_04327 [Citreicella sp. 357]KAA8609116.1 hypothetical protein AL036_05220 [Salipiger aestuarii]KAA8614317.1 hypothetical protein AL037_03815 [Salipiger aestuarii]KAB2542806.1 hypothetical protein AL035_05495 [Salipiger aestuarii]RAK20246.1 uncharacterized metal-binding protein YceD (DUF177 family) [Salipiger aestuarii]
MNSTTPIPERLRVAGLRTGTPTVFDLRPDDKARAAIAARLGLLSLRKLRFSGALIPEGRDAWRLDATLGATVAQPCVVTLEPVTTRIDEPVERVWRPIAAPSDRTDGAEIEISGDDIDPLPEVIDLRAVLTEALALALPLYPHAPGAREVTKSLDAAAAPDPEDERPNPFAALEGLKSKLGAGSDDGESDGDTDGDTGKATP